MSKMEAQDLLEVLTRLADLSLAGSGGAGAGAGAGRSSGGGASGGSSNAVAGHSERHNVGRVPELDYFARKMTAKGKGKDGKPPPLWALPYGKAGEAGALPDTHPSPEAYLTAMQAHTALEFQARSPLAGSAGPPGAPKCECTPGARSWQGRSWQGSAGQAAHGRTCLTPCPRPHPRPHTCPRPQPHHVTRTGQRQ